MSGKNKGLEASGLCPCQSTPCQGNRLQVLQDEIEIGQPADRHGPVGHRAP